MAKSSPDQPKCRWKPPNDDPDQPHPTVTTSVWFDGSVSTSIDDVLAEIEDLHAGFVALKKRGGQICDRDGRHIYYDCEGAYTKDDPFGQVQDRRDR
ncbi:MAG: hypothetical protein Q8Q14_16510 [Gemmatimonadales bacterium]|nr:hypothetical protein [Gemmatimonadales bacterium]